VSHAKATWYADICQKIHEILLTKDKTAHHNKMTNMAMRPIGSKVTNASKMDLIFTMSSTVTAPQILQFLNMFYNNVPCGNSMTPSPGKNSDVQ